MSNAQIQELVILTQINCGECGGTYAINERYRAQRQQKGDGWTCPYCKCSWGYFNNGDNAKLKRDLEEANRRVEFQRDQAAMERKRRESAEHRERAQKAAKTRIKNRIANGVCPCCNRTFLDLQRHMSTKHADYVTTST
jgi:hypothetical protein